jgi:hypothetical protein
MGRRRDAGVCDRGRRRCLDKGFATLSPYFTAVHPDNPASIRVAGRLA